MIEQKNIECPFCKAKISCLYKPPVLQYAVTRISSRTSRTPYMTKEKYEILVEKCPNCGKTKKEILDALYHGKELTNNEVLKRLKEAGLDPSRLK